MTQVVYQPSGVVAEVPANGNLRDAADALQVEIASTCGGVGSCGLCKVRVVSGDEGLAPLTPAEKDKLGNVYFITRERLACQACVVDGPDPVVVEVPDATADKARRLAKADAARRARLDRWSSKHGSGSGGQ